MSTGSPARPVRRSRSRSRGCARGRRARGASRLALRGLARLACARAVARDVDLGSRRRVRALRCRDVAGARRRVLAAHRNRRRSRRPGDGARCAVAPFEGRVPLLVGGAHRDRPPCEPVHHDALGLPGRPGTRVRVGDLADGEGGVRARLGGARDRSGSGRGIVGQAGGARVPSSRRARRALDAPDRGAPHAQPGGGGADRMEPGRGAPLRRRRTQRRLDDGAARVRGRRPGRGGRAVPPGASPPRSSRFPRSCCRCILQPGASARHAAGGSGSLRRRSSSPSRRPRPSGRTGSSPRPPARTRRHRSAASTG